MAKLTLAPARLWKKEKPTEPGAYYVRGFNLCKPKNRQFEALVQVRPVQPRPGQPMILVCNLHESTSEEKLVE